MLTTGCTSTPGYGSKLCHHRIGLRLWFHVQGCHVGYLFATPQPLEVLDSFGDSDLSENMSGMPHSTLDSGDAGRVRGRYPRGADAEVAGLGSKAP